MDTHEKGSHSADPKPFNEENAVDPGTQDHMASEPAQADGTDTPETPLVIKRHQQHGNRKYTMFKNHSSANDQPRTITDTRP